MSGIPHSIILSRCDVINEKLVRQAVDASLVAAPSPKSPFLRTVGGGYVLETNGLLITNISAVNADVQLVIDTPRGTFIAIDTFPLPGGGEQVLAGIPVLAPGQSLRVILKSTSAVGAELNVLSMFSDFDTAFQIEHELTDDWADVVAPRPSEVLFQIQNNSLIGVLADPGIDIELDLRIEENGEFFTLFEAQVFQDGFYEQVGTAVWLRDGQKLQARKTAGRGAMTINFGSAPYFFRSST